MQTETQRVIKFLGHGARWFDRVNGNTYHSVRIERVSDGAVLVGEFQYGYGDSYRQTGLDLMVKAGWLPEKYNDNPYAYNMDNGYPIEWSVSDGLKRDCVRNGKA